MLMEPPKLTNWINATVLQLRTFEEVEAAKKQSILNAEIKLNILQIDYKTKSGFFVRAFFDNRGKLIKKRFFRGYDISNKEPLQPVKFNQ